MVENWLSIVIFLEVLFTLFIAWGFMHEDKFIAFEDKIIANAKQRISKKKSNREFM